MLAITFIQNLYIKQIIIFGETTTNFLYNQMKTVFVSVNSFKSWKIVIAKCVTVPFKKSINSWVKDWHWVLWLFYLVTYVFAIQLAMSFTLLLQSKFVIFISPFHLSCCV